MKPLGKTLALLLVTLFLASLLFVPSLSVKASNDATQQQNPTVIWSKTYTGDGAYDAIQTSDGGFAAVSPLGGYTLTKLDSTGGEQWSQTYSLPSYSVYPKSVVQTSDGGYAIVGTGQSEGGYAGHVWLVKTDSNGTMQWNRILGDTQGVYEANSLAQTSDGGYAIAGDFGGYTGYTGLGGWNFLFMKTDASGNLQWTKLYGGPDDDRAEVIVQTTDGGYALAGCTGVPGNDPEFWLVKTDSAGNMQWNQSFSESIWDWPYGMTQTSDGGYALVGVASSSLGGSGPILLLKTDSAGNIQWTKNIGTNMLWATSVIQTRDGGYAVTGGRNFVLAKTDAKGNVQWTYNGTNTGTLGNSVIQTADGNYVIAGEDGSWITKIVGGSEATNDTSPTPEPSATPTPSTSPSGKASIWLSCQSQTSTNIRANIVGALTANGTGIPDASILLSYSVDNGLHWNELTCVNTDQNGDFNVLWTPSATGNYLLNATWIGNSNCPQTTAIFNVAITPANTQGFFSITTNSTMSQLNFDSAAKQLSFTVSGPSGTTGYLDIYIPKSLISNLDGLTVNLDGNKIPYTAKSAGDCWLVSFTYHHSTHQITLELNSSAASKGNLVTQAWFAYVLAALVVFAVAAAAVVAWQKKAGVTAKPNTDKQVP